ncbi:coiled-coil domain-containing protein 85A-like [Paramacrobiotus metropolitanus]|uniref:coiled-coil domain-containing protein 85A-like n=1 Tax=Paramacrobiotus metropolitanus TaxID=2943436 RepID=UPI0024459D5D|nr:coiled-coil domain-containing protein 85A-like [Paramacrobiotus metropolitanus]
MNGPGGPLGGGGERETGGPSTSPSGAGSGSSANAMQPLSDEQLLRMPRDELIGRLRSRENECVRLLRDRAQLMKDVNRTLQLHLAEVRGLREINQALQKDNSELRDLSCFLDDDRQKARKIAKEWQKFGKYTSTVMRQEVTAYQVKLYELEQKQESLLRENTELKELCLYLDDDREARRHVWMRSDASADAATAHAQARPARPLRRPRQPLAGPFPIRFVGGEGRLVEEHAEQIAADLPAAFTQRLAAVISGGRLRRRHGLRGRRRGGGQQRLHGQRLPRHVQVGAQLRRTTNTPAFPAILTCIRTMQRK